MSVKSPGSGAFSAGGNPSTGTLTLTGATPSSATSGIILGTTTSGTATAGTGGALPATVQAYLEINVGGTLFKVPYFAV